MALIAFVFLNVLACLAFAVLEARDAWRRAPRRERRAWAAVFLLMSGLALLVTRNTVVRAGWPNEHGFQLHELDLLTLKPASVAKLGEDAGKELSPLALKRLFEAAAGRSLALWVDAQKALWIGSALLTALALLAAGAGGVGALAGAGFYLFSWLSVVDTYALATTNSNVFFFLCGVCALARWRAEPASRRALSWFLCASFLAFCARFEFIPALAWGFLLSWPLLLRKKIPGWLWAQGAAVVLGAVSWGATLLSDKLAHFEVANPWKLVSNLNFQLGQMNLSMLTGAPRWLALPLTLIALGLLARRARDRFWPAFLAGWILYFSVIFSPTSVHLLFNPRHHLYFFLPFTLLLGLLAGGAPKTTRRRSVFAGLAVAAFAFLNWRTVSALQTDVRTCDREWKLLMDLQARWPASCRVVSAAWQERRGMLARLFPAASADAVTEKGCYLIYRSAYDQIFDDPAGGPALRARRRAREAVLYGAPVEERRFTHAYYTNYGRTPKSQETTLRETWDPVPVVIGFYRLPPAIQAVLSQDGVLLRRTRPDYDAAQKNAALDALAAARLAVPDARGRAQLDAWDPRARARFLCDRGVLAALLGKKDQAEADLRASLAAGPGFPAAALTLGGLYEADGKRTLAAKVYADALRAPAFPGEERAREALEAESSRTSTVKAATRQSGG